MIANKGDSVVCVETSGCDSITIGKIYEVLGNATGVNLYYEVLGNATGMNLYFLLCDDEALLGYYSVDKFISLSEWREQQINKIL